MCRCTRSVLAITTTPCIWCRCCYRCSSALRNLLRAAACALCTALHIVPAAALLRCCLHEICAPKIQYQIQHAYVYAMSRRAMSSTWAAPRAQAASGMTGSVSLVLNLHQPSYMYHAKSRPPAAAATAGVQPAGGPHTGQASEPRRGADHPGGVCRARRGAGYKGRQRGSCWCFCLAASRAVEAEQLHAACAPCPCVLVKLASAVLVPAFQHTLWPHLLAHLQHCTARMVPNADRLTQAPHQCWHYLLPTC
jgi:hypothetical protein